MAAAIFLLLASGLIFYLVHRDKLPSWVQWEKKEETVSFTDGSSFTVRLSGKKAVIKKDTETLWTSDPEWKVSDFVLGDIDHDGETELLLLVWKRGSYGDYKPFWVEEDEDTYSQHIFIYDLKPEEDGPAAPIWMSSKMGIDAASFFMDPEENLHIVRPDGVDTVWRWESWGLTLQS